MVIIRMLRCAVAIGLLLMTTVAFGQTAGVEALIDSKMRQTDPRLNTLVTLSADRTHLGELLEMISSKTNVVLSIDENDSFSGVEITCDLKRLALADAMNSLISLLGSKNGAWEWKADTGQPPTRYYLRPTQAAHKLADRISRTMQAALEDQAAQMIPLAFVPLEERKVNVERYIASIARENPAYAKTYVVWGFETDQVWDGIRLFVDLLSVGQRMQVLRGETIDIPTRFLAEEDRQLALALEGADSSGLSGWQGRPQEPVEAIRFQTLRSSADAHDTKVSSLEMYITFLGKGRAGGRSYFGVLRSGLLPRTREDWILPGDVRTLDVETRPLMMLTPFNHENIWNSAPLLDYNIAQLAATESVSFMAVMPEYTDSQQPTALGRTPAQYFAELDKVPLNLMHKWREGVLLINHPTWFYGDQAQYSYGVVKRLRDSLRKRGGYLSLEDVADLGAKLSVAQLNRLGKEFLALRSGGGMTPVCAFWNRYPASLNEQGVPVDLKMRTFLQAFKPVSLWPTALKAKEQVTAIRIHEAITEWPEGKCATYSLQFTTSNQKWTDISVFRLLFVPSQSVAE